MPFFWKRAARNIRDRKQGDGVTKLGAKLCIPFFLFTDKFPLSSSGNPLSLMLLFEANKENQIKREERE